MAPSYKKHIPVKHPIVDAAVLLLLYPIDDQPYFVLIKRTPDDLSPHGGQVSLPGGKFESSDITYLNTALRETSEEIGIPVNTIYTVGSLSSLIIPVSGYRVYPFVGYLNNKPVWSPNSSEVSYIIEVSIKELIQPENVHYETIIFEGNEHSIPYFKLVGEKVWGATAMILAEFKAIILQIR
ncbi:MAG TPA: CoA pyrophosphatase [Bacteroidales bacterium]|nr:CoA pyrophosphatase [Bacteroidales bacterium]HPO65944.1 CoA pyrophosphatase [Bacteroidales bacterium]